MHDMARRFTEALDHLHRDREVGGLVSLFADDATLAKADTSGHEQGQEGARRFWQAYREVFDDVDVRYEPSVTDDGAAVLEWVSTGTLQDGRPVEYQGVSILRGGEDAIGSFRTYYDSSVFQAPSVHAAGESGPTSS